MAEWGWTGRRWLRWGSGGRDGAEMVVFSVIFRFQLSFGQITWFLVIILTENIVFRFPLFSAAMCFLQICIVFGVPCYAAFYFLPFLWFCSGCSNVMRRKPVLGLLLAGVAAWYCRWVVLGYLIMLDGCSWWFWTRTWHFILSGLSRHAKTWILEGCGECGLPDSCTMRCSGEDPSPECRKAIVLGDFSLTVSGLAPPTPRHTEFIEMGMGTRMGMGRGRGCPGNQSFNGPGAV